MYFGAYIHPDFQKDNPTRACTIQRRTGSTLGSDRRFTQTIPTAVNEPQIRHCGTKVNSDLKNESFSSLGTWQSSGEETPDVRLDSDWNTNRPTVISVMNVSDSLLPRHVSTVDDWLAALQMAFAPSPTLEDDVSSPSQGMLSFAEFKSFFEPRPIEFMINK